MADTVIDISEIIAQYGAYYLGNQQQRENLFRYPYRKFGTKDAFYLRPTNGTRLEVDVVEQQEIIQAYQDDFTPKGGAKFIPRHIDLVQVKIDQEFNPNKLVDSAEGYFTNNSVNRSEWPFIRWFIEEYLMKRADDDLEMKVIYGGSRVEPTAGTAGATVNAMTGVKKLINNGITAGEITPYATGAIKTDLVEFVDQIEAWCKLLPEEYWKKNFQINMSNTLELRYTEGVKKKYNMYYAQENDLKKVSGFGGISVIGRDSMTNANKIWATLPGNMILAVKGFSNKDGFLIEHAKRKVAIYTDWWMGLGYILGEQIFTNDQDLT